MISRSKELAKNTFIIAIGRFSSQIISLILLPIYTFYLSPVDVGLIDLIFTYVALLVPVLTIQLEMSIFRYLVDARKDEDEIKKVISNAMQIVAVTTLVALAIGYILANIFEIKYAGIILFIVLASMISSLFMQIARGLGDNKRFAKASVFSSITMMLGVSVLVIYGKNGASGVLIAMALANIASATYLFINLKIYKYISLFKSNRELKKQLISYSLPLVPNGISWWIISVSDRTIIAISLGLAANGIYAISTKYAMIYMSIFAIFSLALTESASLHINKKDSEKFLSGAYTNSMKVFGALGLILIAIAPIIFKLFVGPDFQQATQYVPILILASFCNAIVLVYSAIYVAKKLTKQVATTSIMAAVINIVLTILLVRFIGIYAAALATFIAYFCMAIYRHYDVRKYIRLTYEKHLLLKIGAAYVVVIGLYYIKSPTSNLMNFALAAAIAILLNWSTIGSAKNMFLVCLMQREARHHDKRQQN